MSAENKDTDISKSLEQAAEKFRKQQQKKSKGENENVPKKLENVELKKFLGCGG